MPPQRNSRPRPVLTGRALVLGAVLVLLIVLLAAPVQRYFASRGAVSGAAGRLDHDKRTLKSLQEQKARYDDPGYVQQQARSRLQYAMPGDTVYTVVGQGHESDLPATAGTTAKAPDGQTWTGRLMGSLRAADR